MPPKSENLRRGLTINDKVVTDKLYSGVSSEMPQWNNAMHWLIRNEMALHVITAVTSKPEEVIGIAKPLSDERLAAEANKILMKEFELLAEPDRSRPYGGERISNMLDFFAAMRLALEENESLSPKDKFFQAIALDRIAARTIVETFLPQKFRLGLEPLPETRLSPIIAEHIANLPADQEGRAKEVRQAVYAVLEAVRGIYKTPDTTEHVDPKSATILRNYVLKQPESL